MDATKNNSMQSSGKRVNFVALTRIYSKLQETQSYLINGAQIF